MPLFAALGAGPPNSGHSWSSVGGGGGGPAAAPRAEMAAQLVADANLGAEVPAGVQQKNGAQTRRTQKQAEQG